MPIDSITGLPIHPLVVHAAVVLVPLAVLATVGLGWRERWRASLSPWFALVAWGAWAFAYLAVLSGGPFERDVRQIASDLGNPRPRFGEHPELGQSAALLAFMFALACTALFVSERWGKRYSLPTWAPTAIYAGTALLAAPTLLYILRAGHTGAKLVWGTP